MTLKPTHKYDDIIHLPHPVSGRHPAMSLADRAAQFSPFAALTGYEGVIREAARLTDGERELTEGAWQQLNRRLQLLSRAENGEETVQVLFFSPDERKSGGSYVTVTGRVKRVDTYKKMLVMTSGEKIPLGHICRLEGAIFEKSEGL